MKPKNYKHILFTGIFLLIFVSVSHSAEWMFYASSSDGIWYYDKANIKRMKDNKVRVWVKTFYFATGKEKYIKAFGDLFKDLKSTINLFEINCNEKKWNLLKGTDYNSKGSVIHSTDYSTGEESFIVPDSLFETLYEIVCEKEWMSISKQ